MSALLEEKALAVNIAGYVAKLNELEAILQAVFEKAVGGNGLYAGAILGHVQSIATRIDIIESTVLVRGSELPWSQAVTPLFQKAREANAYRNKLAHALYVKDGSKVIIANNIFANRKTFKQEAITAEAVRSEFHRLEELMMKFLLAMGLPVPKPNLSGHPETK